MQTRSLTAWRPAGLAATLLALTLTQHPPALADEGMWLYNAPPTRILAEKHGFTPTAAWLERVRRSSVRFNSGGSGSLVSEDGLVLSNHHVGADALQKFGDARHDYLKTGFYARTRAEEKKCHDLELNVLMGIEDVTARVNAAVTAAMTPEEAAAARRAVMAKIEKEAAEQSGLRCDVVTLYQGGQYHLYRYHRYTDVRLVFAPEQQIAFFGGDPDNFEYPRFNLDICLFRAYENGKPVKVEHYLPWAGAGVREGDLVFVSGHPGNTSRQLTMAELEYLRDTRFPYVLQRLHRLEVLLSSWSERSQENGRRARDLLFGVQNGRKARTGMLNGLLDPELIKAKQAQENRLRTAAASLPEGQAISAAWNQVAQAQQAIARLNLDHLLLEQAHGIGGTHFGIARTLLRAADERDKPNGERLREFRDSNRTSLELGLFSEEPLYDDLETLLLSDGLVWLAEKKGLGDPLVQTILAGQSPRQRAATLVAGTRVKSVAFRRTLYATNAAGIQAAGDPMLELARLVDTQARSVRKAIETQEELKRQAYGRIAAARFAVEGTNSFPDATFTLRLAFGTVSGYPSGTDRIPFQTTYAGLYERAAQHEYQPPFDLPARWLERKKRLDLTTPFNFVCTADIIGGNSGSPVVNRQGEFVGIIFDGNIESLVLDFSYTDQQARAVSVNSQAILEALRKVYDARELVAELTGKRR